VISGFIVGLNLNQFYILFCFILFYFIYLFCVNKIKHFQHIFK
jgi:hypothetical protein